jgi:hypothetical protein
MTRPVKTLHTMTSSKELYESYSVCSPPLPISKAAFKPVSLPEYIPEWLSSVLAVPKLSVGRQKVHSSGSLPSSTTTSGQKDAPLQLATSPAKRKRRSRGATGTIVAGRPASVSSSSRSSSEADECPMSPGHAFYSVFNLIHGYTNGRPYEVPDASSLSKISDDPLERGSKIFWKYRKRRNIVPQSKKAAVPNIIEDLYNSPLMDGIEWTTAES